MQTIIDNVKILGPILVIVWLIVIIMAIWKPQRYFNSILLMGACMFTLFFITSLFGDRMVDAMISCFFLVVIALFTVPVMLIINGIVILKREAHSFKNMLSLFLGIFIAVGEIAGVYYVFQLVDHVGEISLNLAAMLIFVTVFYFSCLILSFVVYTVFIEILPHKMDFDFIIIHGSGLLNGDTMGKLLTSRVDKAIEVFNKCGGKPIMIPSGGQGPDEKISEAQAMKNYLLEHGIPEEKIVLEDRSSTTHENLRNSKEIIDTYAGKRKTALISSNYHIYRCLRIAKEIDMKCVGVGAKVAFYYWPSALIREFFAVFLTKRFFILSMLGYLLFIGPLILMYIDLIAA
ncbi:MAG: YdcF family protein [Firmicutes bacterium]|nr:YdcF family protein [Bacillota bacterium]